MEYSAEYLAGFFDGEGSVGIYPRSFNRAKTIRYYVMVVSLGQSGTKGKEILDWCCSKFGGSVYLNKAKTELPINKQMWKWNVSADKAVIFLKYLYPHICIKKEQIDICLLFQNLDNKRFDNDEATSYANVVKCLKQ